MSAVTYSQEAVAKFLDYNFVPVQIQITNTALVQKFGVSWTPAIMVLDADGKEYYRSVGFLAPEEFIATFQMGKGRYYLDTDQFPEAEAMFEEALSQSPQANAVPEAIFFMGVARFKHTHDVKPLKEVYETLTAKYPQSDWAKRAEPYKLLPA
jgi:tetratricopeptide (TPR) repeat protein